MSSCPNGCIPRCIPDPPRNLGTTLNVGQPTIPSGHPSVRRSRSSSYLNFHQPRHFNGPIFISSDVKTARIKKRMTKTDVIAALCRTNRRRTICPWLKPSISLFWIAFSPPSFVVSTKFFFRFNITYSSILRECVDRALNRANQQRGLLIPP